ncbi:putative G-protein coupled receptor Mth-like 4 [Nymphon striatum]|nr:putative G-protein coupled receptor Mth-like 4 [Nymphon striatum]
MNETNVSGSVQPELINSLGFNAGPILSAEMMLSMICLIITCVIYLKLPELRNVPGKIVISICSCLFFTYLFLIMDFSMRKSGNSISYAEMYAAWEGFGKRTDKAFHQLSFIYVIKIICIAIFYLKRLHLLILDEDNLCYCHFHFRYSIYSWIISLVLTVPVFVFDNIEAIPEYYKPKFGRKRCWLSGTTAFLIYFNLPVGLTLFANLIFFVHTVIVLRRLKEQTKMLNIEIKSKTSSYHGLDMVYRIFTVDNWSLPTVPVVRDADLPIWCIFIYFICL